MSKKKKIAFIFPGQGAQVVGMSKDFAEQFSAAKEIFEEADDRLKYPLSKLIFNGPLDELTLTKHCQVAIFVASLAIRRVVAKEFPDLKPDVCAGLSLGEYSALVAADKLLFADGLPLVKARGTWMQEACESHPGTMAVVLGSAPEEIAADLKELEQSRQVWIANLNCPGQVVLAGTLKGIALATEVLKGKGVKRILPLDVAGAFHCPLMERAKMQLTPLLSDVPLQESQIEIVMNVVGAPVADAQGIRANLTRQVTSAVLWEKGVRSMGDSGTELYIEMGQGKTLSGMNKRIGVLGTTINIEKVEDLEKIGEIYATT